MGRASKYRYLGTFRVLNRHNFGSPYTSWVLAPRTMAGILVLFIPRPPVPLKKWLPHDFEHFWDSLALLMYIYIYIYDTLLIWYIPVVLHCAASPCFQGPHVVTMWTFSVLSKPRGKFSPHEGAFANEMISRGDYPQYGILFGLVDYHNLPEYLEKL